MKVFLDASVLVAATLSRKGGSFRVVYESSVRGFQLVTSRYACHETEGTLQRAYPAFLDTFHQLTPFLTVGEEPPVLLVKKLCALIDVTDAPILAAAVSSRSRILLTLDRKHFIGNRRIPQHYPALTILTPGDFIQKYF